MSRKSRRNPKTEVRQAPQGQQVPQANRINRRRLFIASVTVLLLAFVVGTLIYKSERGQSSQEVAGRNRAALASDHSPTLGKADARVHVVEFLDPACETCAVFYPHVKKLIAANPDRIRLSVRHVPFHKGSDDLVRVLEAARNQGRYWQTLETLLATQDLWAVNHTVRMDLAWRSLEGIGLDLGRIRNEMNAPEITRNMERDIADARALGVTKTPEFFVNGRPLPRFGLKELQDLVGDELRGAYR
jgi:protein-disulfide isomerase